MTIPGIIVGGLLLRRFVFIPLGVIPGVIVTCVLLLCALILWERWLQR